MNPLITVDEHNDKCLRRREERERVARLTGVACPKCGNELEWSREYWGFATFPTPTTAGAECTKCSLTVRLEK